MKSNFFISIITIISFLIVIPVFSLTNIPEGPVSGTWNIAGSPYLINGDITLSSVDLLIIEPGVTVSFTGYYNFNIQGRLLAEGTLSDTIRFNSTHPAEGWSGLKFSNGNVNGQDSSKVVYTRINGGYAQSYGNGVGGAISLVNSSNVLIKRCYLSHNQAEAYGGAIYINESSHPILIDNTMVSNNSGLAGGGIYAYASTVNIIGGVISDNTSTKGGGIYFHGGGASLAGVTITRNRANYTGGGIYFNGGAPAFSSDNRCSVYDNYAVGAGLDFFADIYSIPVVPIILDMFSVDNPSSHFAYPIEDYSFDFTSNHITQVNYNLYVSPTGSDFNSGISSGEPLQTVKRAVQIIKASATNPRIIYLDSGTYSEDLTGEDFPINIRSHVSILGISRTESVLDGGGTNQLFFGYGDDELQIEGVTLQNGWGDFGGAVHLEENSSPHFSNIIIQDNIATNEGGGFYCFNYCNPIINDSDFFRNVANSTSPGGGFVANGDCNPVFNNVLFDDNEAYTGGGLSIRNSCDATLNSVTLNNNRGSYSGGGMAAHSSCNPVLNDVVFTNNIAGGWNGGALDLSYNTHVICNNVSMMGNSAFREGGAIYFYHSVTLEMNNSLISDNTSSDGGGIYGSTWSYLTLKNCDISDNNVIYHSHLNDDGGALRISGVETSIINSTICNNTVINSGGGIYTHNSDLTITNSIIWGNEPDQLNNSGSTINATYSNIESATGEPWFGAGCLDTDPLFENTILKNYRLTELSSCINSGMEDVSALELPARDLDGSPRILGGRIDMGAYEYIGDYLFPPENIRINVIEDMVVIEWDPVVGATSYKIISSNSPFTGFSEDLSGSFAGSSWTAPAASLKLFYHVVALNALRRQASNYLKLIN